MAASTGSEGPLAARRKLGDELRTLRTQADMTAQEVGLVLGCHYSKISRIETAKLVCTKRDFDGLMELYGVKGVKLRSLTALMIRGRQRSQPWWHTHADVISANYAEFLAYEQEAVRSLEYQSILLPALLQTADYARAVTSRGVAALGPDQVDTLVEVRLRRQERLQGAESLRLEVVVTEAALCLQVGGGSVMRAQLRHLATVSLLENVSLRVTPFKTGENGASTGAFILFATGTEVADVAFTESADATTGLRDEALTVRRLNRLFKNLSDTALSEQDSRELVERIEKEMI